MELHLSHFGDFRQYTNTAAGLYLSGWGSKVTAQLPKYRVFANVGVVLIILWRASEDLKNIMRKLRPKCNEDKIKCKVAFGSHKQDREKYAFNRKESTKFVGDAKNPYSHNTMIFMVEVF